MSTFTVQSSERLSKAARQACYTARDAFYSCVRESGVDFAPGTSIPPKCKAARSAFEKDCIASWVEHFDQQQEATIRRSKVLASTINQRAGKAAGSLSGKAL